jgi:VanZ family protein
MALTALLLAVYGSFLPLLFKPIDPEIVRYKFQNLPWLKLGIYSRADWVANGLIFIVPSVLACAAIDWGSTSRLRLICISPFIVTSLCAVAVGIEYFQAYVPTRTQSMNDLIAGCIGAALGLPIYLIVGRLFVTAVFSLQGATNQEYARWLLIIYVLLGLGYAVMPVDLMFKSSEYAAKYQLGRLNWGMNFTNLSTKEILASWLLSLIRGCIFGVLCAVCYDDKTAIKYGLLYAILYEAVQIPVFTRTASLWDVVMASIGIPIGLLLKDLYFRHYYLAEKAWVWFGLAILGLATITLLTLGRSTGWVADPDQITQRWASFWDWPFAKYYYTSEFEAGSNLLKKLAVFSLVGFCFAQQISLSTRNRVLNIFIALLMIIGTATFLEVMQVYPLPHIADINDVFIYSAGALLGWVAHLFMFSLRMPEPRLRRCANH